MRHIFLVLAIIVASLAVSAQRTHTVVSGETLESIAERYNLGVDEIVDANPGVADLFYAGLKLNIPYGGGAVTSAANGVTQSTSDRDHYRRSSLCLVLLAHSDKQYAEAMTRIFQEFPMPARYNEHNVDVRVIQVNGKQSKEDIDLLLRRHDIAKSVVARWFNRNSVDGRMDMSLIHERGGYGAFHDDYVRSLNNVRGTSILREEGIELLESTFVLVCDMDYIDKKKGFQIGALVSAGLSIGMGVMSAINEAQAIDAYNKGDYSKASSKSSQASTWQAGSALTAGAAAVLNDIGGFRVRIHAYLYRLNWDDYMTGVMFNNYWVDESTPRAEASRRRSTFDSARFGLEYVGDYKAASDKTILRSWSNEDEVILDVCERAVAKSITNLSKRFVVFRPRTPFYFEGPVLYSHIGTKEDVEPGKKYEIVQRSRDKKGKTSYKRIGVAEAISPWNNRDIRFDNYFDDGNKGTAFNVKKGNREELAQMPGLQIREMK